MSAKPPPLPSCRKQPDGREGNTQPGGPSLPPPLPSFAGQGEPVRIVPYDAPRPLLSRCSGAMVPWFTSFLFHQALLLGLAFWMFSSQAGPGGPLALLNPGKGDLEGEPLESSVFSLESLAPDDLSLRPELAVDAADAPDVDPSEALNLENADRSSQRPRTEGQVPSGAVDQRVRPAPGEGRHAAPRLRQAASIEGAVGGVIGEIQDQLGKGDLLVVWLLDASISMENDRPRVAARLDAMFRQPGAGTGARTGRLTSAAVAFGRGTHQLVPPTTRGERIVRAVPRVPTDPSGIENVFGAVQWAVNRYSKRWPGAMMIVVWTDESGNDEGKLESTIALCREHKVSVSVMGPSSILTRAQGTLTWLHKPSGRTFRLAVDRGLDSAFLEQCRVPYWYAPHLPGPLPPWYGGPQLEQMVSGFGPYALVRLTAETFGTYTVFDQPADRGPFRLDVMEAYLPDYRSADQIAADLKDHPLRQAVVDVARLAAEDAGLRAPQLVFFSSGAGPLYYSPARFRNALKGALVREQAVVGRNLALVQNALARFGRGGMEEEYRAEESARWRAWYDLTRGRLLAQQVRHLEYATACKVLTGALLGRQTNHVRFLPAAVIRSGPAVREQAQEAERLLRRCVEANRDTPWAYLAQRELDEPLGIDFQQFTIPPPPPQPVVPMMPAAPGRRGPSVRTPHL